MRIMMVVTGLFLALFLSSCGDSGSSNKVNDNSHILDSQMKAIEKARQVEGDINAAMKRRDREMNP